MRTFILVLFTLLFLSNISAQHIIVNDEFANTKIEDIHFLSEDSYIQAIIIDDNTPKGAIQWVENNRVTKQVLIDNIIEKMRFRVESEGIKVDVQIHSYCDIHLNVFGTILLDTVSTDLLFFDPVDATDLDFKDAYNFGDSVKYYLTYDKTIVKSKAGAENDLTFNVDFFESLLDFKFINDKVFIYGGDTLLSINVNNLDTSLIGTNGNFIYDMAEKGDELYVLGSETLDKFDKNGSKLKSIDFPDESLFAYEVLVEGDRLFIIGSLTDNDYNKVVYELVQDEIFIEFYKEEYETLNPGNMYWNPYSGLVLIGELEYDTYPVFYGQHAIMIDLEKEDDFAPDLELTINKIESGQDENGTLNLEISLNVTNNGQDTAKNVHFYSSFIDGYWCSTIRFDILERVIFPGETKVISKTVYPFFTSNIIDQEVCFWVNGSDRKFDPEFENHFVCQQVVGTEDLLGFNDENPISVSPNPARDILNIAGNFNGSSYVIYSLNGQNVLEGTVKNQINTGVLNPGIYFLQVIDEHKMRATKFVKVN